MRKVQRWRYYCDHCRKAGGSAGHMAKHERGCTNNPGRVCGVCDHAGRESRQVPALVVAFGIGDADGIAALRELCADCPACILAAIRQSKTLIQYWEGEPPAWTIFEFRPALAAFWAEVDEARG